MTENENLKGKKLIVLEDDHINILLLKALLEKTQADTVYCENVDEFLDVYKGDKDVILLDINMPGDKTGIDALKEVRKIDSSVPVIMQTAYSNKEEECKKAGADEFLTKPHLYYELIPTIKKLLNKLKNKKSDES